MTIGLSSYSHPWSLVRKYGHFDIARLIARARRLNVGVVQLCDVSGLEVMTIQEQRALRRLAEKSGVVSELGTRGLDSEHLRRYVALASGLGISLIRTIGDIGRSPRTTPGHQIVEMDSLPWNARDDGAGGRGLDRTGNSSNSQSEK